MKQRWRRFGCIFLVTYGVVIWLSCVSRSLPSQRFVQSSQLATPSHNVTLEDVNNFSFAVVGDLHIGNQNTERFRRILSLASQNGDSFLVALGDIVDKGEREDFVAYQSAISESGWEGRVFPVIGNHDIFYEGWDAYRELLGPSHYSVTLGNNQILALDTADGIVGEEQYQWLSEQLSETTAERTFIVSHYMPIIPDQQTYLKLSNQEEAIRLMKLSTEAGVKAWFGAHYHSYISKQIESVQYVVAGGGGGRRMAPVDGFFYVQIKVNGGEISYQYHSID